jgi:Beta-lactamase enzyme family
MAHIPPYPRRGRGTVRGARLALLAAAAVTAAAVAPAAAAADATAHRPRSAASAICRSAAHPKLAARMSRGIASALAGRQSVVGLGAADSKTGITCGYHAGWQFYSASVVKVTILAALLHKAQVLGRPLTSPERYLAKLMITQSDNDAASALWNDTGRYWLRRFLKRAKMTSTVLGPGGYWGLTLITAHDELIQLHLLATRNKILSTASRRYELRLMKHVVAWQRWGVPAGAPATVTVHVKNGWLPLASRAWHINSIGAFTSPGRAYLITVLTNNNPTMSYGVTTVENAASVINHDLNPGTRAVVARTLRPRPGPGG